jgi:MYXO-CTERM domain-containing protein
MSDPTGPGGTSPEEIEADIARQREELAETVTELQARLDVKSRAQAKAAEWKDRATTEDGSPRPEVVGAAVAAVALVVAVVVWRRRH